MPILWATTATAWRTAATKPLRNFASAFTLMEALIASAVLVICVLAAAATLGAAANENQSLQSTIVGGALGQELLEEVLARPFPIPDVTTNPGWKQGQSDRSQYDDMADFDGYTDSSPIKMLDGTTVDPTPGISYTRTVSFAYMTSPTGPTAVSGNYGLLTITVTPSRGHSITLIQVVSSANLTRQ
jgi:Tfp pilus assembly protein PilV